ncbi:PHD finger protein 24 [Plakobranchus ocellatus]|uniref:PHD finger protein 24 n=1 Tax=Plakobranchus ocellatus TaxID=259542 RepID=A0AAV4BF34_9GAST|nr:PHD finger protein 24 [Plakobranchus ocellatus]
MGNQSSSEPGEEEGATIMPKSTIAKLRVMTKFTHDHRLRVDERAELYQAIAELKENRRRLSEDLDAEKAAKLNSRSISDVGKLDFLSEKPSWEAYENEKFCALCEKPAKRDEGFPCRVCPRLFHRLCLSKCGACRDADLKSAAESALTNAGWSCYNCTSALALTRVQQVVQEENFAVLKKQK